MNVKKIKRKILKFFFEEQWYPVICDEKGRTLKQLMPPKNYIWADPFPVVDGERTYIFLEEQRKGQNGRLGYIELYADCSFSSFTPILEKPYHLSWPNVIRVENEGITRWYLIPESGENNTVDVYWAVSFPDTWEFCMTMLSPFTGADPEVYQESDSSWWLFVSGASGSTRVNRELHLYHSTSFPSNNWHKVNDLPVVTGVERSRMAGKIFRNEEGFLIRPAQSCKGEYGQYIVFNHIEELTKSSYRERSVSAFYPTASGVVCTHTWNRYGKLVVRDEKKRWFSIWLYRRLRDLLSS